MPEGNRHSGEQPIWSPHITPGCAGQYSAADKGVLMTASTQCPSEQLPAILGHRPHGLAQAGFLDQDKQADHQNNGESK